MTKIESGMRALLAGSHLSGQQTRLLILAMSLAPVVWYLSAWMNIPIYPDEIATRVLSFRAIADHGMNYSVFPYCAESWPTPLPMLPFAYLLSAFDWFAGWSFVRIIPLIAVLAVVVAALLAMQRRATNPAALLIPLGFAGVAGSGLIMMRPEWLLALQGATVFSGYWLIKNTKPNGLVDSFWILGSTIFGLLSLQLHSHALVLFPLSLIITISLVVRSSSRLVQALGIIATIWIAVGSFATLSISKLACNEYPVLQAGLQDLSVFGPTSWPKFSSNLSPWIEKFQSYADQFSFKELYSPAYLPGFGHEHYLSLNWLNTSLSAAALTNLAVAVIVIGWASIRSTRLLFRRGDTIGIRLASFFGAGSTFLAIGGSAMLALLLVDPNTRFYRCHYIHLALVLINAAALSTLPTRRHVLLAPAYCLAIFLCLQSTVTASKYIDPKFVAGWEGVSLSLKTNWTAVSATASHLAKSCGIVQSQDRIIVDDLTYTALREHPHLIPITYLRLSHEAVDPELPLMDAYRKIGTGILVKCEHFGSKPPVELMREGNLCCANFT